MTKKLKAVVTALWQRVSKRAGPAAATAIVTAVLLFGAQTYAQESPGAPTITIIRMAPASTRNLQEQEEREAQRQRASRERAVARSAEARAAIDQGRLMDAADLYRSAVAADPDDPVAALGLGETCMRLRRFLDAIPPLQAALRLGAGDAPVVRLLATALRETGDRRGADALKAAWGVSGEAREIPRGSR